MGKTDVLKEKVNEAYAAVQDLSDDNFKLEGFKLVLASLLAGQPVRNSKAHLNQLDYAPPADTTDQADWQSAIANKLGISGSDVAKLYHLDNEGSLRLILDTKYLPKKSLALATKQIAALICAGRQGAKHDGGSTSFEIIRRECEEYGVLNKSNFTSYLRKMRPKFIIEGKGQDQSMRVTAPGFDEAAEIAKKYLGQEQK